MCMSQGVGLLLSCISLVLLNCSVGVYFGTTFLFEALLFWAPDFKELPLLLSPKTNMFFFFVYVE